MATLAQRSQANELPQTPVASQGESSKAKGKTISAEMETEKAEGGGRGSVYTDGKT